jgi:anti-sigma factor RsiW
MKIDEHDLDWNERLQDWLDGELDSSEQAEFDTHVASCTRCREKLRQFERMDEALRAATPPISLDNSFDARLFAQIDEADGARRAAARERVQAEIQTELQLLTRNWRQTLGTIIPGIIAGIALAFAFTVYFDTADWVRALADESAGEIGRTNAMFVHALLTSGVGAAIGYVVARWLTPSRL